MKILVFDNYDSFTYNLVHLVEKITGEAVDVFRNDQLPLEQVAQYDKIILSPGPGVPSEAGLLLPLLREYASTKSILGVCLGHQAIAENFGATLLNLPEVYHGIPTEIFIGENAGTLLKNIPSPFRAGRYHSWVIDEKTLPQELEVTARDASGNIMGVQHRTLDVAGVQFHPESIMTQYGETLLRNFLSH